jgi:hypothetical protein
MSLKQQFHYACDYCQKITSGKATDETFDRNMRTHWPVVPDGWRLLPDWSLACDEHEITVGIRLRTAGSE